MNINDMRVMNCNSSKFFLSLVFALTLALLFAFGPVQTFAKDDNGGGYSGGYVDGGGYGGPGPTIVTVEQAKGMRDDARVALKGKIIQRLSGEHYLFQDATGTIEVEIEHKRWRGQNIGPDDIVVIYGEVDREWTSVEIEVKQIIKQ
jgi:uncharacterized protein (TIGR00156 family)